MGLRLLRSVTGLKSVLGAVKSTDNPYTHVTDRRDSFLITFQF